MGSVLGEAFDIVPIMWYVLCMAAAQASAVVYIQKPNHML